MRLILTFLLILIFYSFSLQGQDCSGSFGENIFPDGNFGAGRANILRQNPGIAPGYTYISTPPPNDGQYTITNNTTPWGGFATDWVNTADNSPDPDGYMMVVNASFEPGLFYRRIVDICGNTVYEFSADVISMNNPNRPNDFIKPNLSFLINGEVVLNTGNVPIDGKWHTYSFIFTSPPDATELELALRNNAPGGIGNDLALDNITFRPCGPTIELFDTIPFCGNRPLIIQSNLDDGFETPFFQWQTSEDGGDNWIDIPGETTGELSVNQPAEGNQYRLLVANSAQNIIRPSCRIVSNFSTLSYSPKVNNLAVSICEGDTYSLNGQDYQEEGLFEQLLTAADGCDSLIRLRIEYGDPRNFAIRGDSILCDARPAVLTAGAFSRYEWSDGSTNPTLTISTEETYSVTVTNDLGCTASDEITARNSRLNAQVMLTPPRCPGADGWQIDITDIEDGFPPYLFRFNEGDFQESSQFTDLSPGPYEITVLDESGCPFQQEGLMDNGMPLSLSLEAPEQVSLGDSVEIGVSTNRPVSRYSWSPEEGLSCTDCPFPYLRPLNNMTYRLEVADENGCLAVDSFFIRVEKKRDFFAPNAFSPNGDGVNDYFRPFFGNEVEKVDNFRVFSRWGNLIFEQREMIGDGPNRGWDGRINGEPAPAEVYIWMGELLFIDGIRINISGDVMLLR